jgi:hypothetical protein
MYMRQYIFIFIAGRRSFLYQVVSIAANHSHQSVCTVLPDSILVFTNGVRLEADAIAKEHEIEIPFIQKTHIRKDDNYALSNIKRTYVFFIIESFFLPPSPVSTPCPYRNTSEGHV